MNMIGGVDDLSRVAVMGTVMLLLVHMFIGLLHIPSTISDEESEVEIIGPVPVPGDRMEYTRGPVMESDDQGGSWFDDFDNIGGLERIENVTIKDGFARSGQRAYRIPITLVNNDGHLYDFQVKIYFNESLFDYTKAEPNGEDIRFTLENGTKLHHWIEKWNQDGNSTIWINIPDLPEGSTTIQMYYGCPEAEDGGDGSAVFDFFDDFSFYNDTKWESTGSSYVNNGHLTVTTGAVYSHNAASTQPGRICEAKVKWNNFASFSGLCVGNTHSTQGSNEGSDKVVYLMTNMNGDPRIMAWAGSGNEASYDIISGATQYTAAQGVEHTMGYTLTDTNLTFHSNNVTTNTYTGTWSGPFYIWLGFFTGSRAGNADISDIAVDRVLVRKIGPNPEAIFGLEEQNPSSFMISESISLPQKMHWEVLTLAKTEHNNSEITVSILNTSTNITIPGFANISSEILDISNLTEKEIRLKAVFNGGGTSRSTFGSWGVEWVNENTWRDSFLGDGKIDGLRGISIGEGQVKLDHWRYKRSIEITYAGENLTDFQIMVPFNNTYFDHSNAKPAGEDIRFYDEDKNELQYWIEEWNLLGYSRVWINMPSIKTGTSIVWMYYGNPEVEGKSNGDAVFDFFDDFNGNSLDSSKWDFPDNTGWSVAGGRLKGTNNNGRILSKATFSNPIIQELKTRITTRAANGFQGAGFYSSNTNCFGYLCHPGGDWLRNEGAWVFLEGEHVGLNSWYNMRITAKTATLVNIDIENFDTGAGVYNRDFTNAVWNERVALGKRSDDWTPDQPYEAYWDYVRTRKFASVEPSITMGEENANPVPFINSVPISLPKNMLWSSLSLNKTEPGNVLINLSILDANNETIEGFDNLTDSTIDIDILNDMNISEIRLGIQYFGIGMKLPILNSWCVNWSEIFAPKLITEIADMEIQEDSTAVNILNLSAYYKDIYKDRAPSRFALEYVSDTRNISLALNGSLLHVIDLRTNWLGQLSVVVNCTNYYERSTLSNLFNISVVNVNDPPLVELVAPMDRSVITENSVTLSWNATDIDNELSELTYDIYFSDDPSAPLYKTGIAGVNYTIDSLEDGKKYYWYVIPHDREETGSCMNASYSFTVNTASLILLFPEDSAIVNATGIDLQWHVKNTNEAWKKYHIYLGGTSKDLLEINETYEEYFSLDLPNINDTYYWKIVAEIGDSNRTIESEVWSFTTIKVFVAVHKIELSFATDRVSGIKGINITVELNISNHGNVNEEVLIDIIGDLAGKVGHVQTILLAPGQQIYLTMDIRTESIQYAKVYLLKVRATYSGDAIEAELDVDISDKQTSDDVRSSAGWLWTTLAIIFILVIIVILLLIIRRSGKKRKEKGAADKELLESERNGEMKETTVKAAGFAAVESPPIYSSYAESSNRTLPGETYDDFSYHGGIIPPVPAESQRYDYRRTRTEPKRRLVGDHLPSTGTVEEKIIEPEIEVLPPKPIDRLESFLKSSQSESRMPLPQPEIDVPTLPESLSTVELNLPVVKAPEIFFSPSPALPDPPDEDTPAGSRKELAPEGVRFSMQTPLGSATPSPNMATGVDAFLMHPEGNVPRMQVNFNSPEQRGHRNAVDSPNLSGSDLTNEEPTPSELDDFTGISETDTIEDEVSPISPDDNVLDAFSKYLQKLPDSLTPSERDK
ncbi:MAG: DUF2341 domain-containing protein [Candidatus Thermoplasmatota archaeon]|nr:DUF2341 domain-containing protein [Candidatus Thermoplasmatota archaeon]